MLPHSAAPAVFARAAHPLSRLHIAAGWELMELALTVMLVCACSLQMAPLPMLLLACTPVTRPPCA
eukprot:1449843-Rhodomonas_salina.2